MFYSGITRSPRPCSADPPSDVEQQTNKHNDNHAGGQTPRLLFKEADNRLEELYYLRGRACQYSSNSLAVVPERPLGIQNRGLHRP